jgi:hypothetical protein
MMRLVLATFCCSLASCITTRSDGRTYLHHFGYARILVDPGDAARIDEARKDLRVEMPGFKQGMRRGSLNDTRLLGLWLGAETGFGYRHQIRASTPKDCHLAVHARNEHQLEQFISLLQSAGITGENVCAVPLSL